MYLVTHIIVFALFPAWFMLTLFNPESVYRLKKSFGRLLLAIVRKDVIVTGLDNVEVGKHYLIVANYPSFHTGFMLMMLFPEASIVVHDFMSRVPVISGMLQRNGFIYARRKGFRRTKHTINTIINNSESSSIIILPEGKRTPDGRIREFKRGFIHILRYGKLDLLPVTLSGFYRLKPANRHYMDPDAKLAVIIHKPISHSVIKTFNEEQLLAATMSTIEESYEA